MRKTEFIFLLLTYFFFWQPISISLVRKKSSHSYKTKDGINSRLAIRNRIIENRGIALESSTTYFFYKTKRAKRESWYTRKDQEQFRSNALRDAAFFRALKHSRQGIDPSIYDEKVCFWGLEKAMCRQKAVQSIKNKMALVRAVIEIRALSNVRLDVYTVEEEAADISRQLSKASKRQAYEIALLQEQEAKKIVRT